MSNARPTRRAIVGAAAWSLPAVAVVTAAPAMAASTPTGLGANLSALRVERIEDPNFGGFFYEVVFDGISITSTAPVAAGSLSLLVSFTPTTALPPNSPQPLYLFAIPSGWTSSSPLGLSDSFTLVYGGSIAAGGTLAFPDGNYFGTNYENSAPGGEGVFTLTLSSPGSSPLSVSLTTPGQLDRRSRSVAPGGLTRAS